LTIQKASQLLVKKLKTVGRPLVVETAAPEKLWPGNVRALQYPHQARKVTEFGTMS